MEVLPLGKIIYMYQSSSFKGYLYAVIATIALSNVYIFSKAALNEVNLAQFGVYWFGFAIIWNIIFSISTGKFKTIRSLSSFQKRQLFGIGIVEIIATVSIFIAIKIIPNPTIPSMLRNLEPVLIVILAAIILQEKYNRIESIGVILTLLGTIVISINKLNDFSQFFITGVEYVFISCVFYAIRTIWSKKVIHHFTAHALNLNKVVFLFITSVIALLITKQDLLVTNTALFYMFIGSLIGPFLTSYTQFLSFQHIDASRSTLVMSTTGFITLVLSYIYFGKLPYIYQILGGIITVFGLILLMYKRKQQA